MEILGLLAMLWRRKGTIALSTLLFLAMAGLGTWLLPKQYTAETQVIVEGDDSSSALLNDLGLSEMAMSLTKASDDITNKIYRATSAPIMRQVIWKLQLRKKTGELYLPTDVSAAGLLGPVLGTPSVTVVQTQGTDVLVIDAVGPSREAARLMADSLADVLIAQETTDARAEYAEAQRFVADRIVAVTGELDTAYGQFAELQRNTSVIDLDAEQRAAVARLSELTMDREAVFAQIKETHAKLDAARDFNGRETPMAVSSQTLTTNPIIGKLQQQLAELTTTRQSLLLDHYTERAPEVVETDAKIAAVKSQLTDALVTQQDLDPAVATLQADLAGSLERQRALTDALDRTATAGAAFPELHKQFAQLQLKTQAAEGVYRSLQDQAFQLGIVEAMTMSDIKIVSRATRPDDPSSPKTLINLIAGLVLGLGFGVATALLRELLDDSVRLPEDAKVVWDLPHLGVIPRYRASDRPALADLPASDPLVEAHRAVRNAIEFATLDKPVHLVSVTSSVPGEGKSTLAMNLAIAAARDGRKVLLVDADLRLPTQHKRFPELRGAPGLVELLTRAQAAGDAVQHTPIDGLDVLAAGAPPPNPGTLAESLRMRQTLLELGRSYDLVIVDTPPVLAVNDPINLARAVDGVILVVEAGVATKRMLTETKQRFESAHIVPIGMVMNKVRPGAVPYGQYARYYRQAARRVADAPPPARSGGAA